MQLNYEINLILMYRQRYVDPTVADNGLPRERLPLRLSQSFNGRHERHDKNGTVDSNWIGSSAHGNCGYAGKTCHCSSRSQIKEHTRQDKWDLRHW